MDRLEVRGREAPADQRVDQEPGRRGLEPVRLELAAAEQLEQAEGVVDPLGSQPTVAVVPGADLVPVETRQLRGEDSVEVRFSVAAEGRVGRVHGEVDEVVEIGEQADPGELAHPGDEGELDVGVAGLEGAVQPAQVVAVGPGHVRVVERVQDRLVVLVHQHHDAPARVLVQRFEQAAQAYRGAAAPGFDAGPPGDVVELRRRVLLDQVGLPEVAAAEVQSQHRVAPRPVPAVVDGQAAEQGFGALVQRLERIHEQALAESPRA